MVSQKFLLFLIFVFIVAHFLAKLSIEARSFESEDVVLWILMCAVSFFVIQC
jgi:hypothetical protein